MPSLTTIVLAYVGLSLAIGGVAATYELHSRPTMLDRADGRGKFPSPKMSTGELIAFGFFAAIAWPVLLIVAIYDLVRPGC